MTMDDHFPQFSSCTPFLSVSNLLRSRDFYVKKLGFKIAFEWGKPLFYIGLARGNVSIHLSDEKHSRHESGKSNITIIADEIDDYYQHCREQGITIICEPGDREYGVRDFGIEDIDGNILNFGCEASNH